MTSALHAVARLATPGEFPPAPLFGEARPSLGELDGVALYDLAAQLGVDYGSRFRTVRRIGSHSKPRATSTSTSPVGSQPWHVPSMYA